MAIPVDQQGQAQFPLERGKWIAYPATDWAEQPDVRVSYFSDDEVGKLMQGRITALRSGDTMTARDFEDQIEALLNAA